MHRVIAADAAACDLPLACRQELVQQGFQQPMLGSKQCKNALCHC
jgi:hypothetical protein